MMVNQPISVITYQSLHFPNITKITFIDEYIQWKEFNRVTGKCCQTLNMIIFELCSDQTFP